MTESNECLRMISLLKCRERARGGARWEPTGGCSTRGEDARGLNRGMEVDCKNARFWKHLQTSGLASLLGIDRAEIRTQQCHVLFLSNYRCR